MVVVLACGRGYSGSWGSLVVLASSRGYSGSWGYVWLCWLVAGVIVGVGVMFGCVGS